MTALVKYKVTIRIVIRPGGIPSPATIFPGFLIPREVHHLAMNDFFIDYEDLTKLKPEELKPKLRELIKMVVERENPILPTAYKLSSCAADEMIEASQYNHGTTDKPIWKPYPVGTLGITQLLTFEDEAKKRPMPNLASCGVEACVFIEAEIKESP